MQVFKGVHGIVESFRLENPLRASSPSINPGPTLTHGHNHHSFLKIFPGMVIPSLPKGSVPIPGHPFSEEIGPNLQPKLPLLQSEAVSPCPIPYYQGEVPALTWSQPPTRELKKSLVFLRYSSGNKVILNVVFTKGLECSLIWN